MISRHNSRRIRKAALFLGGIVVQVIVIYLVIAGDVIDSVGAYLSRVFGY